MKVADVSLVSYFVAALATPSYYATPENGWAQLFLAAMPEWIAPSDAGGAVITKGRFHEVSALLERYGVPLTVLKHEPVYTSEEAARVRGAPLASGAKVLLVKADEGSCCASSREMVGSTAGLPVASWTPGVCASPRATSS